MVHAVEQGAGTASKLEENKGIRECSDLLSSSK
jgi:hypothetical protein